VHRDAREFASILRDYEQWRVFDLDHLRRVLKSRNIPEDCYALNEAGRGDCIEIDGDADEWHVVLNKDEVRTVICNSTTEDIACRTLLREITSLACSKTPTARTFA
jgi:hypothetical protein